MKKPLFNYALLRGCCSALAVLSFISLAKANPYASGITNLAGGQVSFVLNENATDVSIVYAGGAATNDLGALTQGIHTFPLTFNSSTYSSYAVNVFSQGNGKFHLLSTNSNPEVVFFDGRGVAVNCNPSTGNFGRIYVANSGSSTITYPTTGGGHTRAVNKGIYMMNADLSDAVGQTNTARLGGMIFGASSIGPNRISVGPDDTVYVGDDDGVFQGGQPAYGVWAAAPDISSAQALFSTNGAVYSANSAYASSGYVYGGFDATPRVTGSLAQGNLALYGIEYDQLGGPGIPGGNTGDNLWAYPINGTVPYTNHPQLLNTSWNNIGITGVHVDLAISTNGYNNNLTFYCTQDRNNGTGIGNNSLTILDQNGQYVWDSESAWAAFDGGPDQFNVGFGVAVSPDGSTLAESIGGAGQVWVMPLTNGIPDLSRVVVHTGFVAAATDSWGVAFDAANNIYIIDFGTSTVGTCQLVEYSQGQTILAITSNDTTGTNGTFSLSFPFPQITVTASASVASQNYANAGGGPVIPGTFTITRTGGLTNQPLTVFFTLTGAGTNASTASAGSSTYAAIVTNSITLQANELSADVTITPDSLNVPRLTEPVVLTVITNSAYALAPGTFPSVNIVNTGPQALQIGGVVATNAYKGLTNDFASFTIQRLGDTNFATPYIVSNFTYSGTGAVGVDYTSPARTIASGVAGADVLVLGGGVMINPGDVNVTATISPLQTITNYTGNRIVTIGLAADSSVPYTIATNTTATMVIIDNAYPPAPVLFADPLTNGVDGNNNDGVAGWNIVFGSTNATKYPFDPNYVQFAFPLANDAIGNAPDGATTALKLTVNKDGTGSASSSAINLYPTNVSFSGNYALRFSMLINEGSTGANATEGPLFGINHAGTQTNWYLGDYNGAVTQPGGGPGGTAPWFIDGVWYGINADASGVSWGDYVSITGAGTNAQFGYIPLAFNAAGSGPTGALNVGGKFAGTFASSFKNSYDNPPGPYNSYQQNLLDPAGLPVSANKVGPANAWADVEVKQINNVITMSINKTPIFSYANTNLFNGTNFISFPGGSYYICTNGTIMLGYVDPFASIGTQGAAYFSNIKVVRLGVLSITGITLSGGNVTIHFTSGDGDDTISSFTVLSSGTAGSAITLDTAVAATITQDINTGGFTATFPQPVTSAVFYRIKHN
ncbi:MAG TPA: hypothetical protein VH413_18035 [Verrucomicrobiae bacterium]|nr:hypothetical protein [Verrucomicrobiae bacterium]